MEVLPSSPAKVGQKLPIATHLYISPAGVVPVVIEGVAYQTPQRHVKGDEHVFQAYLPEKTRLVIRMRMRFSILVPFTNNYT